MSRIPRPVARKLDGLSRAAHRFHRYAHHPLCDEYAGEVIRLGRRGRVCRGCLFAWTGAALGIATPFVAPISLVAAAPCLAVAVSGVVIATLVRRARRPSKLVTRLAPSLTMGIALGAGLRAGGIAGLALAALTLATASMLVVLYRRRGPDRTPCERCPERLGPAPCRGFAEIVQRERVFRRAASRVLARAGIALALIVAMSHRASAAPPPAADPTGECGVEDIVAGKRAIESEGVRGDLALVTDGALNEKQADPIYLHMTEGRRYPEDLFQASPEVDRELRRRISDTAANARR